MVDREKAQINIGMVTWSPTNHPSRRSWSSQGSLKEKLEGDSPLEQSKTQQPVPKRCRVLGWVPMSTKDGGLPSTQDSYWLWRF